MKRRHYAITSGRRRETGVTLLEVLIAMVVFAAVMLGAASAQLVAVSSIRDANMRSYAAFSADSLAAIMRGNPAFWRSLDDSFELTISASTNAATGAIVPAYSSPVDLLSYNLDLTSSGCDTTAGNCLPAEVAISDLKKWSADWVTSVTSPVATISNEAAPGETPLLQITLSWRQKQLSDTGGNNEAAMLTNQYSTRVKMGACQNAILAAAVPRAQPDSPWLK